jgi:hypothetical protein
MASFFRFQRVRIVRCDAFPEFVGQECTLTDPGDVLIGGRHIPGWATNLRHPNPIARAFGSAFGVLESQIEPLRYLPSPEDFVSLERVPPEEVRETVRA